MDFDFPPGNRFKVHMVHGKDMSAGRVKRKDATWGRKKGKWAKGSNVYGITFHRKMDDQV